MVYLATKFGITLLRYWKDVGRPVLKALSTSAFDTEPLYNKILQVLSAVEGMYVKRCTDNVQLTLYQPITHVCIMDVYPLLP